MTRLVRFVFAASVALLGATLMFRAIVCSGLERMQTDPGDARHLNYVLEHAYLWVTSSPGHSDLWSPPVFYPERNTGAYTETLLGVAPFYVPLRAAGLRPDTAFQVWTLVVGFLNFAVFYLLLRRPFRLGVLASAAGAYLFAFSSIRAVKVGHQHLIPQFFAVGVLWACVRMFELRDVEPGAEGRRRVWILAFFAALVAQAYASFYLAWFLVFALLVATAWALLLAEARRRLVGLFASSWRTILLGGIASAAMVYPLAAHHLAAARTVGYRDFAVTALMVPRLQSWVNLGPFSLLYGQLASWSPVQRLPVEWEHRLGLGFLTPLLAGWGLIRHRSRSVVGILLITGLTIGLLATLFPGGLTLWRVVFAVVPGANALRAVSRVALILLMAAAIGLALAVEAIRSAPGRRWLLLPATAFVVLEQVQSMPSFAKAPVREDVAALVKSIPSGCQAFYYAPIGSRKPVWESQLDAMWASLEVGVPTVNGYSSNLPPGWEPLLNLNATTPSDVRRIEASLQSWLERNGIDRAKVCLVQPRVSTASSAD